MVVSILGMPWNDEHGNGTRHRINTFVVASTLWQLTGKTKYIRLS